MDEKMDTRSEIHGLDWNEAFGMGKFLEFELEGRQPGTIGDKSRYILGLIDHIRKMPDHEVPPDIRVWSEAASGKRPQLKYRRLEKWKTKPERE